MTTEKATISVPFAVQIVRNANQTIGRLMPGLAAQWSQLLLSTPRHFTPRDWELEFEAIAKRSNVGSELSVLSAGDGPTVALIHGWEGRATQFAALAPVLIGAGFRVVAIDGPAHGHSSGRLADPYRFADAIAKVVKWEGPLHGIVGHSMGGTASAIAVSSGVPVKRVVTIASPASLHDVLDRYAELVRLSPRASTSFRRKVRRGIIKLGHRDTDVIDLVKNLSAPAMIIHDRDDLEVPFSDAERLSQTWPHSVLLAVEGVGHRRILRSAITIQGTVNFLNNRNETP